MHIDTDTTDTEVFISAHRAEIAIVGWLTLTPLLVVMWIMFLNVVCGIYSVHLNLASAGLIIMGMGIAALAFYWAGDES